MSATSLTTFFGDAEYRFDLDATLIAELETKTDAGFGALFKRIVDRSFRYADLLAVLRLGLIGGGTKPEEAARLVKVYGEGQPIEDTYPVVVAILSAMWFGNAEEAATTPIEQPAPEPVVAPVAPIVPAPQPEPAPVAPVAPDPTPASPASEASLHFLGDIGSEV